jgi:hypothetical protein
LTRRSAAVEHPFSEDELRALEALDLAWGATYDIAVREGKYLAKRIDGSGPALTGDTPEELDAAIRADQAAR